MDCFEFYLLHSSEGESTVYQITLWVKLHWIFGLVGLISILLHSCEGEAICSIQLHWMFGLLALLPAYNMYKQLNIATATAVSVNLFSFNSLRRKNQDLNGSLTISC